MAARAGRGCNWRCGGGSGRRIRRLRRLVRCRATSLPAVPARLHSTPDVAVALRALDVPLEVASAPAVPEHAALHVVDGVAAGGRGVAQLDARLEVAAAPVRDVAAGAVGEAFEAVSGGAGADGEEHSVGGGFAAAGQGAVEVGDVEGAAGGGGGAAG